MTKIKTVLEEKAEALTAKKRIKEGEKRLEFKARCFKKLVEFFDGIIIHPTKGVILTPKKKRQLAELNKMEQELLKKPKKFKRKRGTNA